MRPLEQLAAKWARERQRRERERRDAARAAQDELLERQPHEATALEQLRREPDDDQPWGQS
jgi:hypothetical protein